ncbi:MAG: alpha-1,3-mannosyltransferase family protein [Gemmataceae bacterium]|nr:alpha-1,3-mannosyltransferase family protein [Gemmataceae bacterium]
MWPCAHLGDDLPQSPGRRRCSHPRHRETDWAACQACPDYLFPVFTPFLPQASVRRLIALGPRDQPDGWWHLDNVQRGYRELARRFARRKHHYPDRFAGRGIVLVGGGAYFACAYVTIRVLRHVGCRLPIELWHLDDEMNAAGQAVVEAYGVTCRNADALVATQPFRFLDGHWWKGWQLKPYAIAHSAFEEVLYLDADCYPVRDPEFLFSEKSYRRRGAIFWPDLLASEFLFGPRARQVFGVDVVGPPLESGQMLIDKRRSWPQLQSTLWYNAHADYVYRHLWGDKDTFALGWALHGRPYAMLHKKAGWEGHTILQYDAKGRVLFQHRCRDKFRLKQETFSSNLQHASENIYHPKLALEDFCFEALAELRCRLRVEASAKRKH